MPSQCPSDSAPNVAQWETPVVIAAVVVLLNVTIGFVQESRAEASLEALKKMLVTTASVRRDGHMMSLDAADLVVGDVVTVEAGDRVPADGRLPSPRPRRSTRGPRWATARPPSA